MKQFILVACILLFNACANLGSIKEKLNVISPIATKPFTLNTAWTKNFDPNYESGNLPIALNSPLISEGVLYTGSNQGKIMALDVINGRTIWEIQEFGNFHGSPALYKDLLLYGNSDGRFFARKKNSGELVYSIDLGASVESTPVISGGRVFVHLRNHRVFCLDVETGKIFWAYKRSVPYLTTIQRASDPTVYKNKVYVGFADGSLVALSIEEGVPLWEQSLSSGTKFVDVDAKPFVHDGMILVGSISQAFAAFDPESGKVLRRFDYSVSRPPFMFKNKLLIGTLDGELLVLNKDLSVASKIQLDDKSISSIVSWKNKLVVSSVSGKVYFLDTDFKVSKKIHLGHSTSSVLGDMSTNEGFLAILSSRNRLYVFN